MYEAHSWSSSHTAHTSPDQGICININFALFGIELASSLCSNPGIIYINLACPKNHRWCELFASRMPGLPLWLMTGLRAGAAILNRSYNTSLLIQVPRSVWT